MMLILLACVAASLVVASAHAEPTIYLVTELGNLFAIQPPPPPLAPDFDTSPYLERHKTDGILAIMYPHVGLNQPVYQVREMGSSVDLPPQRRGASVVVVDDAAWDAGTDVDMPVTPLAGEARITDRGVFQHGLMRALPGYIYDMSQSAGCTGHMECKYVAANGTVVDYGGSDVGDSNGRLYLELKEDTLTWIGLTHLDASVNFVCPYCDADTSAYVGDGTISQATVTRTATGSSDTYAVPTGSSHDLPPSATHPQLRDVSTATQRVSSTNLHVEVTSASGGSCSYPGDAVSVSTTAAGSGLTVGASFDSSSCPAVGSFTYQVTATTADLTDWEPLHTGYTSRPYDGTRDLIVIDSPGSKAKMQLIGGSIFDEYVACCGRFERDLEVSRGAGDVAVVYGSESHLLAVGPGTTMKPEDVPELEYVQYVMGVARPQPAAGPVTVGMMSISHDDDASDPSYNGLNYCGYEPGICDATDQQPAFKMRVIHDGTSIDTSRGGEIYDVRNNVRLVGGAAPTREALPQQTYDRLLTIIGELDGTRPAYTYFDLDWSTLHTGDNINLLLSVLLPVAGTLANEATSYVSDGGNPYLDVPVDDDVLVIQDVYAVVPFQQAEVIRDTYISKYPCGSGMTDGDLSNYLRWLDAQQQPPDTDVEWYWVHEILFNTRPPPATQVFSDEETRQVLRAALSERAKTHLPYLDGSYEPGSVMSVPLLPNRPYLCVVTGNNILHTTINLHDLRFAGGGFSVGGINHQQTAVFTVQDHYRNADLIGDGGFDDMGRATGTTSWETVYETSVQSPRDGTTSIDMISNVGLSWSALAVSDRSPDSAVPDRWRDGNVHAEFRGVVTYRGTQTIFDLGSVTLQMSNVVESGSMDTLPAYASGYGAPNNLKCAYRFDVGGADSAVFADVSKTIPMRAGEAVGIQLQARAWMTEPGSGILPFCGAEYDIYIERLLTQVNVGTFRVDIY